MKSHGIVFDFDGTLMNSLDQAMESFNFALVAVGERARSKSDLKRLFGAGADRIFRRILASGEKAAAAFEVYLRRQSELANETRLHAGVRELLDHLLKKEVPVGVVTGRHAADLEMLLRAHGLAREFAVVVPDNEVSEPKPSPEGILLAAERLGILPSGVFYVGDSLSDIEAARAAGSVAVAALWDAKANAAELEAGSPDFMAAKPMEVWEFFKERI